jgi:hypothetical protein
LTFHDRSVQLRFGSRLLEPRGASPSPERALFEPSSRACRSRSEDRRPTLMGLSCPAEFTVRTVVAHSVRDTRLAVLTTSRFSGAHRAGTEVPTPPMDLDPLQGTPGIPRRSLPTPATLLRFFAPTATSVREVHQPGFPHPVRSAFRVSHPLDGFLPPAPSDLEDRSHSWGSPCRAFPPRGAARLSAPLPSCRF